MVVVVVVALCQNQNTLFGPHDTSRVSESGLHPFSNDGNPGYLCLFISVIVIE